MLQRHLPRYSAVRPGAKKAGLHRGEAYFLAADVSELHTADKWVQLGRQVAANELQAPFKVVPKRGSKNKAEAAAARDAGDDAEEVGQSCGSALQPGDHLNLGAVRVEVHRTAWSYQRWALANLSSGYLQRPEKSSAAEQTQPGVATCTVWKY